MSTLRIDGNETTFEAGETVLDVGRRLGILIPTLCHLEGREPYTACMVCMVEEKASGRLLPACSTPAENGMDLDTRSQGVHAARRDTLSLMLAEHVGDCEGPCRRGCPANMNIPRMIRQIGAGALHDALVTVKEHIALPAVLGRICHAPCEKACRRGHHDDPVSICLLKRFVADLDLASEQPYLPPCLPDSGRRVAIVGAGPAGLSAAYYLRQLGHACVVMDEREHPGGLLRYGVPETALPRDVLDAEIDVVRSLGVEFHQETALGRDVSLSALEEEFDAVVLGLGEVKPDVASALGLETTSLGIQVDARSLQTSRRQVFAGGDTVHTTRRAVRAVGHGHTMACSVNQLLCGEDVTGPAPHFNSVHGRLRPGEMGQFMVDIDGGARIEPGGGLSAGFASGEAQQETGRCLHCDCRAATDCALRDLSGAYGANQQTFRCADRVPFTQVRQHAGILFEPGKCIKCGKCVRIAKESGEELGLTFIGRGFDVRIGVPLNASLADGLRVAASACVDACPTGALAYRDASSGQPGQNPTTDR